MKIYHCDFMFSILSAKLGSCFSQAYIVPLNCKINGRIFKRPVIYLL
jgi:hypothetical protein